MASGQKAIKYNTRERVISPDQNRAEAFAEATLAEIYRVLMNTGWSSDDVDAGAVASENASVTSPILAEVFDGLMVQPQSGSTSCFVTAGLAFFIDPDSDADASNYKFVEDAGVQVPGTLVIPANAGGSPRIDIIECSWASVVTETDNRDIYDPTTDTFTAQTVTKVTAGKLTYRVRSGSIGGGFASVGTASGWLPLAVVSAPAGSTTCDQCTFWDVRPLINDRSFAPFNMSRSRGIEKRAFGQAVPSGGTVLLSGVFEHEISGRRIGGRIRPGVPLTDANSIDIKAAANQEPGTSLTGNKLWFVYIMTPFGLPRWARYTDGPSGRVPRSPRGIPIVSTTGPLEDSTPSAAISLPTITGLGGSSSVAIMVVAGLVVGGTTTGVACDGRVQTIGSQNGPTLAATSVVAGQALFTLDSAAYNVLYPANAKAIWVKFNVVDGTLAANSNTVANSYDTTVTSQDPSNNLQAWVHGPQFRMSNATGVGITPTWGIAVRVPIDSQYPTVSLATRLLALDWTNGLVAPASATLHVFGWELGP